MAGSDVSKLQAQIDALAAQVAQTETLEGSAVALLNGFSTAVQKAVADALAADDAADQGSIAAAADAISATTARFTASGAALGAAVAANTPQAPPAPNPVG